MLLVISNETFDDRKFTENVVTVFVDMTEKYLMGHSDIGVTMNVYTHLGLDDAKDEMIRMEELEQAKKEVQGEKNETPVSQKMFKVIQEKNQQSIWVQIALGCFYCVAQIGNKSYI